MIKTFLFAIFGAIFGVIKFVFSLVIKLLTKVITTLNLSLPFLYMLTGLLLHLAFGFLKKDGDFFAIFHFGLIVVFAISVLITIKKLLSPLQKTREIREHDYLQNIPHYYDKPYVFRIKDNPEYIVYEFYDKYQIFKETKQGLEYIRTDIKIND